ncbi:hypothetical protein [Ancylobacter sp. TS-1]|uniref:hypothetical protein n=1 Tax=Ancylobacter sp. TS-1 TaxID=1850374 RepID=UPI001FED7F00|nr:hypothetical protein [Ancylobacter sp. TS-1]
MPTIRPATPSAGAASAPASRLPALRPPREADAAGRSAAPESRAGSSAMDWLTAPPTHPEEMKAAYDVRVGAWVRLQGGARMTPAAVVCAGICTGLILMGVAAVVRAGRR